MHAYAITLNSVKTVMDKRLDKEARSNESTLNTHWFEIVLKVLKFSPVYINFSRRGYKH